MGRRFVRRGRGWLGMLLRESFFFSFFFFVQDCLSPLSLYLQCLIIDVCVRISFFALSFQTPQPLPQTHLTNLHQQYSTDLHLLHQTLPTRFQNIIQRCLHALPSIMTLPIVLAHKDFGDFNILVDPETCHLLGVIDWAEATLEPFGINLYAVENLMTKFHLRNGAVRYPRYEVLYERFWDGLGKEIGRGEFIIGSGGDDDATTTNVIDTIQSAMLLGLLLSNGFTSRLANEAAPVPISEDSREGAYKMLKLDSFLVREETKFAFL